MMHRDEAGSQRSAARSAYLFGFLLFAFLIGACRASGQVAGTGIPPFPSIQSSTFDQVNLATGNVSFSVPIFNKGGQGLNFTYSLVFNNNIWTPYSLTGNPTWTPPGGLGWGGGGNGAYGTSFGWGAGGTAGVGYVAYYWLKGSCWDYGSQHEYDWDDYQFNYYIDPTGAYHSIGAQVSDWDPSTPCGSGQSEQLVTATDGSGLWFDVNSAPGIEVVAPSGVVIYPTLQNTLLGSTITDANANAIKVQYPGTTFLDTMGAIALTINPNTTSTTYQYTGFDGGSYSYTVNYTQQTVQTNFQCSGVGEYGATPVEAQAWWQKRVTATTVKIMC